MIEWILSILKMGQAEQHRVEDRFTSTAKHLADIESICLSCSVRLVYEINRIGRLACRADIESEIAVQPLVVMRSQVEEIRSMVCKNRALLFKHGASVAALAEVERWAGTCQNMPDQIELTVQNLEALIQQV